MKSTLKKNIERGDDNQLNTSSFDKNDKVYYFIYPGDVVPMSVTCINNSFAPVYTLSNILLTMVHGNS